MVPLRSSFQPWTNHPGRGMGSYDFYWSCGPGPTANMIDNFFQNHITGTKERQHKRKCQEDALDHEKFMTACPLYHLLIDAAQFAIARTWKQPRCPLADRW